MKDYLKTKLYEQPNQMMTYAQFMAEALYHEKWGYYIKDQEKVGRNGDFITSSNISDIYGRSLAKWFLKLIEEYGLPPVICEMGAGTGRFAAAFIDEWRKLSCETLNYLIVETSPYHRKVQKELIPFDEHIKQVESLEQLNPFRGFIFSNELFDALPVHVIEKKAGELLEVMITWENDDLVEKFVPLENKRILAFLEESKIRLNEKQRIEIPLAMEGVVKQMSERLVEGFVVTVDYGYQDEEWMEPIHKDGSLRGYSKHEQFSDVLKNPGEMDITSHVHFDALIRIGNKFKLNYVSLQRQDEFLLSIGILEELENHYDPNPFSEVSRRNRAIRSLVMPAGMSSYFRVLVQKKGI